MIETRVFSLILALAAFAVAVGISQLLRMLVRDIIERSRKEDAREGRWFE
ncbi:hypothetical protein [Amaricoccus solimangrovi]|nr:hypothetical protein [Amaricoccus solimangrovi]